MVDGTHGMGWLILRFTAWNLHCVFLFLHAHLCLTSNLMEQFLQHDVYFLLTDWSPKWMICSGGCNHKTFLVLISLLFWGKWEGSHHVLPYPRVLWGDDVGAQCRDGNIFDLPGRCPVARFLWEVSISSWTASKQLGTDYKYVWTCI